MNYSDFAHAEKLALLLGCALLSGCSASFAPNSSPVATDLGSIRGMVHGGQQPVVGAHVYVMAAGTQANAGPGIAASTSNASSSLLTTGDGTDALGTYVLTAADGSFALSSKYTCTSGTQVYLYALGGNPGAGTNSSAAFLAALGQCPASQTLASTVPYVWINEVTTVATAYALAGYATDATHISSDTAATGNAASAQAASGIANAFANVNQLVNIATGTALTANPAGTAVVPQTLLNTLADVLASCVNASDSAPGTCPTLFSHAESNGSTGTAPTDTATAAINIAHNPASNVSTLTGLVPSIGAAFQPTLPATPVPHDLTVALKYTGGGLNYPAALAVDASGNVFVTNGSGNSVSKISSTGTFLSGSTGYTGGSMNEPQGVAIDSSGNAWIGNYSGSTLTEISSTGTVTADTLSYSNLNRPSVVTVDPSGNVWAANYTGGTITELNSTGGLITTTAYGAGGISYPYGIAAAPSGNLWVLNSTSVSLFQSNATAVSGSPFTAGSSISSAQALAVDHSGNAWVALTGNKLVVLNSSGTALSFSPLSGGGLNSPYALAFDGAGNAWVASYASLSEFSNAGATIAPSGYNSIGNVTAQGIAVDGSGDVWTANSDNSLSELIGAGVPVVTPIAFGLKNGILATRP